jgi:tetratricopeptide (TPR) repeat protein
LGLADAFVSRLGQLPDLRVLPLTATEGLVGQDPRAIARSVGATHVLTGTLQREDFSVRATVQLFSTADDRFVWAAPVPADASSMFTLQDIIVERLIEELAPWLEAGARRRLAQPGTGNNNAYEAYLRGRAHVTKPTRAELTRAAELFRQAVDWDADYADAWAGLASAYKRMPIAGDAAPAQAFDEARRAATRALDLDASHAEAMSALGTVAFWYEWDYSRAEQLLRGALAIQPSAADAQVLLAHLLSNLGQHDEALLEIRRARTLDSAWPVARALEGQFLFMARRYDLALAHLNETIKVTPSFYQGHVMRVYPLLALRRYDEALDGLDHIALLDSARAFPRPYSWSTALRAYALARLGRPEDAHVVLAQLRSLASEQYVPPHHEALVLHALGQNERALTRLREAVDGRDVFVTFLGVDPKWDGLRDSPEFRDLLSQVNLLEVSDRIRR